MRETATLAGGCFWCTEAVYARLNGVHSVIPGYAGGHRVQPTYEQVTTGTTGHAEAIRITFDPKEITFSQLLDVFWATHDPTTLDQQGNDRGTQYRSIIFYENEAQKKAAEKSKASLAKSGTFSDPLVTEIKPFTNFYEAEEYHRNYFANHPEAPYCSIVIAPKIAKMTKKFSKQLKPDSGV